MNTTPLISESMIEYTIFGGQNRIEAFGENDMTLILLKRRGRVFRKDIFADLYKAGFTSILSLEDTLVSYDLEQLSDQYPDLRFMMFKEKETSLGQKINVAIQECVTDWVFVLWDDMVLEPLNPLSKSWVKGFDKNDTVCIVPRILSHDGEELPFLISPMHHKNKFMTMSMNADSGNQCSLYPYDYCGVYNRVLFPRYSGYDPDIYQSYWQKMDYGLRVFLWGGHIRYNSKLIVRYDREPMPEDKTRTEDYLKFYLKNLAYDFINGEAVVKWFKLFSIGIRSRVPWMTMWKYFKFARVWVFENRLRFRNNPETAIKLWGVGE